MKVRKNKTRKNKCTSTFGSVNIKTPNLVMCVYSTQSSVPVCRKTANSNCDFTVRGFNTVQRFTRHR
jgi:hypothetical protein